MKDKMKDQDFSEEVSRILQEAPSARLMLLQNYQNLNDVADYCSRNYLESGKDSAQALEETKNFTSQSLASVAYQISTLANSLLQLLDAQINQLRHMESSVNLIGQTVQMHREKVCRREIGAFTVVKRVARGHKLLPPPQDITAETRPRYERQPINYSHLDGLGHGVKAPGKQTADGNHGNQDGNHGNRPGSHGGTISRIKSATKPPEPVQCPVAPPTVSSSFGNPVAPPTVPHWPATSSPDSDIIKTLLDEAPPLPVVEEQTDDVTADAPPTLLLQPADLSEAPVAPPPPPPPPPPPQVVSSNHSVDDCVVPPPSPSPPPCLETVVEENSFPPPADDIMPPPANQETELDLPAPPPPPPLDEDEVRRSGGRRSLSTARSVSLRLRPRPATRSLFSQSLMIPPPPSYPPPVAPPSDSSCLIGCSSPRFRSLPARLQHLDLEIPAPPPPPLFDDVGGFDDIIMSLPPFDDIGMPLPPPMDATPPEPNATPPQLEKVVALWPYEALKEDELSFQEGDVITLTHRHGDGWCQGVADDGRRGFFPESYVGQSEG